MTSPLPAPEDVFNSTFLVLHLLARGLPAETGIDFKSSVVCLIWISSTLSCSAILASASSRRVKREMRAGAQFVSSAPARPAKC